MRRSVGLRSVLLLGALALSSTAEPLAAQDGMVDGFTALSRSGTGLSTLDAPSTTRVSGVSVREALLQVAGDAGLTLGGVSDPLLNAPVDLEPDGRTVAQVLSDLIESTPFRLFVSARGRLVLARGSRFNRRGSVATIAMGRVTGADGAPITGALVSLLPSGDGRSYETLTGSDGRFMILAASAGDYRVRAEMLGYGTVISPPVRLEPGDPLHVDIPLEAAPILLEGISVTTDGGRCEVDPAKSEILAGVWEAVRHALRRAALTEREGYYAYEISRFTRPAGGMSDEIEGGERREQVMADRPFVTPDPEELAVEGFLEYDGDDRLYYAPDAEVLISEPFIERHCYGVRFGLGPTAGLIGLTFEPIRRHQVTEVEGTLWVDHTGELRWLEFGYVNMERGYENEIFGGTVLFDQMPNGSWIVTEWNMLLPVLAFRFTSAGMVPVLDGMVQEGGEVLRIIDREGMLLTDTDGGTLAGLVLDPQGALGVQGARVEVLGTGREARTTEDGRFRFGGLDDGVYDVRITVPGRVRAGDVTIEEEVEVVAGSLAFLRVRQPRPPAN